MIGYSNIWISNGLGEIFFLKVPAKWLDDFGSYFYEEGIDEIIKNNYNSCEWGAYNIIIYVAENKFS